MDYTQFKNTILLNIITYVGPYCIGILLTQYYHKHPNKVYTCGTGGAPVLNSILSWKGWQPIMGTAILEFTIQRSMGTGLETLWEREMRCRLID
ncbi:unnamed protein product [Oppiella nova]|uniref:Uncharacterized protein n=1 Tax=Oppiella nova TaxID=334625 RepID=A0A7R9QS52_9ACAR|nr:unnamed protein product [Oppiella nova]CAG2173683.1 unnamed protein product [Oppiella nova]